MIPIYEQGQGKGIGHVLSSFLERFNNICAAHLAAGRARAFAFIFYDFTDEAIRRILKSQGVFAQLDRLSGKDLSVFYLHAGTKRAIETFNQKFLVALGVEEQATLPCVVFFRFENSQIKDIEIVQLESADLIHGFSELYQAIDTYIKQQPKATKEKSKALKWFGNSAKFISVEVFRLALKKGLDFLF